MMPRNKADRASPEGGISSTDQVTRGPAGVPAPQVGFGGFR